MLANQNINKLKNENTNLKKELAISKKIIIEYDLLKNNKRHKSTIADPNLLKQL